MKKHINIKKYLVHFTVILAMLLSIQSCENYLEENDPNSISAAIFWSNLDESNSNLNAVYGSLLNQWIWSYDLEAWRSDLGFPKSRTNLFSRGRIWYQKQFNDATRDIGRQYDALYQVIWRANQLIEGLEGMGDEFKSQDEWRHQMGQARFFRGLMHFYLYSTYNGGNIVLRDKVPVVADDFLIPVSNPEDVIAFVREDLKYAFDNLPYQFEQKTRVTKAFAAAELGKTYLHTRNYNEAIVYLSDVVNNSAYELELLDGNDVSFLHTRAGDFSSESIFELNYSDKLQIEDDSFDEESFFNRWARYSAGGSRSDFVPSSWLTHLYSNEPMDTQDPRNYVDDGSGSTRFRSVPLRCAQMVAVVNDEESEYYQSTPANAKFRFGGTTFSFFKKFSNHDIAASESDILLTPFKSGKNVLVKRLSEVYLNLAECQVQTGDIDGALVSINSIRQRWGLVSLGLSDGTARDFDEIDHTKETLMEHLMYVEYPLELSVEGHNIRTTDMRRWGISKARFTELSQTEFHMENYTPLTGGRDLNASLITLGPATDPDDTIVEFEDSAENYVEALHDYFPLPLSEKLNNPAVNN